MAYVLHTIGSYAPHLIVAAIVTNMLVPIAGHHWNAARRPSRRLAENDGQYGGQMDGRVEQFHAHRNLTASEENHGA